MRRRLAVLVALWSVGGTGCNSSASPASTGKGDITGEAGASTDAAGAPAEDTGASLSGPGSVDAANPGVGGSSSGGGDSGSESSGATMADASPETGGPDSAGIDAGRSADDGGSAYPLMNVVSLFTQPDVPVRGAAESPPTPRAWTPPAALPMRTGNGIAQHPMLYVGENYNRISLVNGGNVVWTYDTAPGFELDDVWMLSNGNILYSHMTFIEEITPKKQVVWHYAPTNGEIHSCQPIGFDKVLFFENAPPPMGRIRVYNIKTQAYEVDQTLTIPAGTSQHGELRRIRMTRAGTYLLGFMDAGQVREYDKNFNVIWTYMTPRPWSVVRLKNGNTLIQDENLSTAKEVDASGKIIWQLARSQLTLPPGTGMGNTQSCERLASGNTVMFGNGGTNVNNVQAVEVTSSNQVVWMLQDWIHLGDATSAQFLDEPGYPEIPGDTNH